MFRNDKKNTSTVSKQILFIAFFCCIQNCSVIASMSNKTIGAKHNHTIVMNFHEHFGVLTVSYDSSYIKFDLSRCFSVLGPRCVISCMMDNVTLPYIDSPMHNLAMRDLIICLSSFDLQEKVSTFCAFCWIGLKCPFCIKNQKMHFSIGSLGKTEEIHRLHGWSLYRSIGTKCDTSDNRKRPYEEI